MTETRAKRKVETLRLTRRQVARREIDAAVTLLLTGGEPVAVNLLAWAAVDVLRGLCEARGVATFMSIFEERIRPEFHAEWRRALRDHHNFLKHSKKDPDRTVEDFKPEASTYAILVAVEDYRKLYETMTYPMQVFRAWFMARNPHVMTPMMAALFVDAGDVLGDIATMALDRSFRSAGDVLRTYLDDPAGLEAKFRPLGVQLEW